MQKKNKRDIYEYTEFDSLNDLIKNISYISKNGEDFIEEIKIIKEIVTKCLDENQLGIIDSLLSRGLYKINNPSFLESLILMFYDLKSLYLKDINKVIYLQNKFYDLIETYFILGDKFSPKLEISGLHIRGFLDIRYLKEFDETEDEEWIKKYNFLINNTIEKLNLLCKLIFSLNIDKNVKKTYLSNQLSELNKVLEYFDKKRDTLGNNNLKKDLINSVNDLLSRKKLEILYQILFYIETEQLEKDFFNIAMKLYNSGSLENEGYFDFFDFDSLDWFSYDSFRGGAQTIPRFNQNKYRLIISFYKYLQNEDLDIKQFKNENFQSYAQPSFEENLNKIDEKIIKKYFDFEPKQLIIFKNKVKKELKKKSQEIKKKQEDYILNSNLNKEYVDQFKGDCRETWDKNQQEMGNFLKIELIENGQEIKESFGQYKLFNKIWFIDSYDKNIGFDRSAGFNFGRDQVIGKKDNILKSIIESFNESDGDKRLIFGDLYQDLSKNIERDKEYYLFYNSEFDIYTIPSLSWTRKDGITASLQINNSLVNFIYANIPLSLLIEKNSFILKQYK
ncbi:MAG: hypothetical protein WCX73_05185, partial [Candidatus Pacearchaeota archaeon]